MMVAGLAGLGLAAALTMKLRTVSERRPDEASNLCETRAAMLVSLASGYVLDSNFFDIVLLKIRNCVPNFDLPHGSRVPEAPWRKWKMVALSHSAPILRRNRNFLFESAVTH
jgi:hypothetical protein